MLSRAARLTAVSLFSLLANACFHTSTRSHVVTFAEATTTIEADPSMQGAVSRGELAGDGSNPERPVGTRARFAPVSVLGLSSYGHILGSDDGKLCVRWDLDGLPQESSTDKTRQELESSLSTFDMAIRAYESIQFAKSDDAPTPYRNDYRVLDVNDVEGTRRARIVVCMPSPELKRESTVLRMTIEKSNYQSQTARWSALWSLSQAGM